MISHREIRLGHHLCLNEIIRHISGLISELDIYFFWAVALGQSPLFFFHPGLPLAALPIVGVTEVHLLDTGRTQD